MNKSNDDTGNPKPSIRDQLRVHTNDNVSKTSRPVKGCTAPPATFDFDGRPEDVEIKHECTPTAPCGRLTCAACSDPYRLRWIRQTLAIAQAHPGQHEIATIDLLLAIPMFFDVKLYRGDLRDLFGRAGFQGALLRGALDFTWDSALECWILCLHVLAIDVPRGAWARLRTLLRNAKPSYIEESDFRSHILLKVRRLRDPEREIANLVKFHAYFWPRPLKGVSRAVLESANLLEELIRWASHRSFNEITFHFEINRGKRNSPIESRLEDLPERNLDGEDNEGEAN